MSDEIKEIQGIGVDIIQFDEPVLTEVVFTEGRPRTFMCAALSERKDPTEELEFAKHLISSVMKKSTDQSQRQPFMFAGATGVGTNRFYYRALTHL